MISMRGYMVYDYIIIGSGIAGNVFAHEISKLNKTCLILEKNTTRIEKICGGGVPRKAIDLLKTIGIDVSDIEPYKFSVVNGVRCTCGDQHESKTYNPDAYAIGIRRAVLDEFLLQKAIKAGADIAYGEYVRNVEEVNGIYIVNGYYAKNVVYACGARGLEEKYISGQSIAMSTIIYGECSLANDFFHYFYLDKTKKKYVWAFPVGDKLWNIGLWSDQPYSKMKKDFINYFEEMIRLHFENDYKIVEPLKGEFLGNVDLSEVYNTKYGIGDFAGLNNKKNGGGITQAIESAIKLATE